MKPVLVLQHVPHETLGSLAEHMAAVGLESRYLRLYEQVPASLPLETAAGLVVLGGPMNVDEVQPYPFLASEIGWIQQALSLQLPLLGICLGSQLLAKALEAKVYPNGIKEIGWYPLELTPAASDDLLFAGCAPQQTVFQWHGDTFALPPGVVHLARSAQCQHQAFRVGSTAYGLQFHIEMTPDMLDTWLNEPGNRCEVGGLAYIDPAAIRAATPQRFPEMAALGSKVLARFAALCRQRSEG